MSFRIPTEETFRVTDRDKVLALLLHFAKGAPGFGYNARDALLRTATRLNLTRPTPDELDALADSEPGAPPPLPETLVGFMVLYEELHLLVAALDEAQGTLARDHLLSLGLSRDDVATLMKKHVAMIQARNKGGKRPRRHLYLFAHSFILKTLHEDPGALAALRDPERAEATQRAIWDRAGEIVAGEDRRLMPCPPPPKAIEVAGQEAVLFRFPEATRHVEPIAGLALTDPPRVYLFEQSSDDDGRVANFVVWQEDDEGAVTIRSLTKLPRRDATDERLQELVAGQLSGAASAPGTDDPAASGP